MQNDNLNEVVMLGADEDKRFPSEWLLLDGFHVVWDVEIVL